jgi:two-component system, NtrC family, sensor kinase
VKKPVKVMAPRMQYWLNREVCYDRGMRSLTLHLKTTLLVSAITLAVMIALLMVISARLVDAIRADEKALAEIEASRLAEHIGSLASAPEIEDLERAATLVRGTRLDSVGVRIWDRVGDGFRAGLTTSDNSAPAEVPGGIAEMLRLNQVARVGNKEGIETGDSLYRVFAPITRKNQVVGAVEISDHLDDLPVVLRRTAGTAFWLALLAVGLIALATFVLFRDLVYGPLARLLTVIERAGSGELDLQVPERRRDELGLLAQAFNRMLRQLHEMTVERERQREILRERVREATAQLEQRNAQLETTNLELWRTTRRLTQLERLAAAGQTAAQFAHEVGTPLNLISCHAQLMQAAKDASPDTIDTICDRAGIIVEQTERIERIVRRMLDRTRSETPELQLLDLNAVIGKITEATAPTLAERKVELELSLAERLPRIAGDADRLQQAFINLISNAVDAMPNGGELKIATRLVEDGSAPRVIATLADTGCGMMPEVQAHIFDPLYTTKERGKGTGLGLVVVSQVMQEHGGGVAVESEPGRGSVFRLTFPVGSRQEQ